MNLDNAIKKRCSVRSFKTKKPDWRKILQAIEAASKAPLAGNIPTVKFILVSKKEKIADLAEAATQDFIALAHYVVVVCSDPTQCARSYDERAKRYCKQQAGAAIQNFLLKITDLGLCTCWTGAFSDRTVKRTLQLPEHVEVEAILPIGYEMGKTSQRKKPKLDDVLYFDVWKNKHMTKKRKPEAK
jgi:nitroreductase